LKRIILSAALAVATLIAGGFLFNASSAHAAGTIDQKRAFGTITTGARICVGPISPSDANGVQIFGFTNGSTNLTWQVLTVSSQSAETVVFQTTARFVDHVVPPSGSNLLFEACVRKTGSAAQDFDLTLNSQQLE
jgi:hypothetical protein